MYRVRKRDGKKADFDIQKISNALKKAFEGSHRQYTDDIISLLALRVTGDFEPRIMDGCIDVEDIQDSAEKVLSECGYSDVAKAYILYRKQRENIRNIDKSNVDYRQIVDSYLNSVSWRSNSGNRSGYSVGGLIMSNSGAVTGNYWLSEVYDSEIAQAHRNGDLYIHDLDMLTGHSNGWSLENLIENGIHGVNGNISCGPARHLNTLCEQTVRFLGIVQNEWAGAQFFPSFDTFLAPFVRKDCLTFEQVKQCIQTFVYGVNSPVRLGVKPSVTGIGLDWTVPEHLCKVRPVTGGEKQTFVYGNLQKEIEMIDRAFLEVMKEGDYLGKQFDYPALSVSADSHFFDCPHTPLLCEWIHTGGKVYLNNCSMMNRQFQPEGKPDYSRLCRKSGGILENGRLSGSLGIVTLNVPRLAFVSENEEEYMEKLDHLLDIAVRSLHTKKTVLSKLLDSGLYPYTATGLASLDFQFGMIGVAGMKEAGRNAKWTSDTSLFVERTLAHIRTRLLSYQKKYEMLLGLEGTEAVSALTYLATKDRKEYPEMENTENGGISAYERGNIFMGKSDDLFEELDQYEKILPLLTGNAVFELSDMKKYSGKEIMILVRKIMDNYDLPCLLLSF